MGKQTAVAMTDKDEEAFLNFLRDVAEIQIYRSFARTQSDLLVQSFATTADPCNLFYIWNRNFHFEPEYGKTKMADVSDDHQFWYTSNIHNAPVIEYSRHSFEHASPLSGRLYWAKTFSAPGGVTYDLQAFDVWYARVVRWVRKHGRQREKGAYNPYYLPDAWSKQLTLG